MPKKQLRCPHKKLLFRLLGQIIQCTACDRFWAFARWNKDQQEIVINMHEADETLDGEVRSKGGL